MRWFTADLHLGHANIIRYCQRPFASVGQMNAALMANWISAVDSSDEVWVLGDVAMGRISETLPLIARLPGRKHLVPGNHDRCWPGHHRLRPQDTQMYADVGFEIHPGMVELTLGGRSVVACHFPIRGDSHDTDRFAEHRPQLGRGAWLLHGHVHEKWRTNGRQLNVGVDVWDYGPVSEASLLDLIERDSQPTVV